MNTARTSAVKLWSQVVRARVGCCQRCGVAGERSKENLPIAGLDAHHVISRNHANTASDERNGVSLCRSCHGWAHGHPIDFLYWWIEEVGGRDVWDDLWLRANNTLHRPDFAAEVGRLRQALYQIRRAA